MTNTIFVNEEHIGEGGEAEARRMVELMQLRGWDMVYGTSQPTIDDERGYHDGELSHDWDQCLDAVSEEFYADQPEPERPNVVYCSDCGEPRGGRYDHEGCRPYLRDTADVFTKYHIHPRMAVTIDRPDRKRSSHNYWITKASRRRILRLLTRSKQQHMVTPGGWYGYRLEPRS